MKWCNAEKNMNNKGSAIITALVVSAVLMVLSLSLLAVAYSLFLSQKANTSDITQRELLYSSIEMIEDQLTSASFCKAPILIADDIQIEGEEEIEPFTIELKGSDFGKYVLNNLWKDFELIPGTENKYEQNVSKADWLYYDSEAKDSEGRPTNDHGNLALCSKYFYLKSFAAMPISVQMYWILPFDTGTKTWDGSEEMKEGTILHAVYRLGNGDGETQVKAERSYVLKGEIKQLDNKYNEINSTGNYKIIFETNSAQSAISTANEYFLPGPLYYDSEQDIPKSFSAFNVVDCVWYIDDGCTVPYSAENSLSFSDENGQQTAHLYTNWGGFTPKLVRFISEGNIIAKVPVLYGESLAKSMSPSIESNSAHTLIRWSERKDSGEGGQPYHADFFDKGDEENPISDVIIEDIDLFAIYDDYINKGGQVKVGEVEKNNPTPYIDKTVPEITSKIIFKWYRIYN